MLRKILRILPDRLYIKLMYYHHFKKMPDLDNPKTFNEKLQWLKLNDRNPMYTMLVDKYEVKSYIEKTIGSEYVIPTLGVWNKAEEINFDELPNQFVLKCTHDSGSIVICKDKSNFDKKAAIHKLNKGLKRNGYWYGREWPYKNVPRKIIAEKYMEDESGELRDYKFMCFNGEHKCSFTCTERFTESGLKVTFFDKLWEKMPFERHYPASKLQISKPVNYDQMVEFAEKLSKDIPFARIDFYEVGEKAYFGEITFYPGSGLEEFTPEKYDAILDKWIKLSGGETILRTQICDIYVTINEIQEKPSAPELTDYKFFCFDGYVDSVMVCLGRSTGKTKFYFFDEQWNLKRYNKLGLAAPKDFTIPKPKHIDEMFKIAKKLSKGKPFTRIDLYSTSSRVYFGEITFFPDSGFDSNILKDTDLYLGKLINLDIKK